MRLLTSFFSKSKPVHFLVLSGLALLYYCQANFVFNDSRTGFPNIFMEIGFLLVFFLSIGLLNFVVKRNRITQKNSYAALLFVVFALCFPAILKSGEILCAGFFVLLALRRVFSLKSGIDVKKKIFDAALWISVSALFVESGIFFLPLVFLAVFIYAAGDYRNWVIPFVGVVTVFVLFLVFHLLVYGSFSGLFSFYDFPKFDLSQYGEIRILIPLSIMLAFSLWVLGDYIYIFKKTTGSPKSTMTLVMGSFVFSIFAVLFSPTKNAAELLFFITPVTMLGANFFQRDKDGIFKEILLFAMIVIALAIPFL